MPRGKRGRLVAPLNVLLVAVPLALVLWLSGVGGLWLFLAAALAIIPLAGLMGRATENLAHHMGPAVGGLLNATFGNAAELILALLALANNKAELVKASITGSIIGNILLVLGLSFLVGGLRHRRQTFNPTAAGLGVSLLVLAAIGLIIPTVYYHLLPAAGREGAVYTLSGEIAVVLAVAYLLSLVFSLGTHRALFAGPEAAAARREEAVWSARTATAVLLAATAAVAVMSELLVGSVEQAARTLHMSDLFVGVIVVAIIGNAAEHSTAVVAAVKDEMDLAFTIAVGSSFQVALFVAPVLVGASYFLAREPLDLHFTPLEVVAVILSVGILSRVSSDGESNWLEGALLLAVYAILALVFYHAPVVQKPFAAG